MNKKQQIEEAIRHDEGKPDYTHIHPVIWEHLMRQQDAPLQLQVWSVAIDHWYYYDRAGELLRQCEPLLIHTATPVLEFGAKKYAALNYTGGMNYSRVLKSFRRHCMAVLHGEPIDSESGLEHKGHAACNVLFAITYELTLTNEQKEKFDDRPKVLLASTLGK